jgi:site-specific recombinase XerD
VRQSFGFRTVVCAKLVRHLPPKRVPNRTVRTREYLTPDEVEHLIRAAARVGRNRHRDATLLLVAYRHGLRVGELVANDGQDTRAIQHYLGHRNIMHTVRYTELASDRFKGFWDD